MTANYQITAEAGKLTINPKAVTVTAASEEFTYDGTAHSNAGYSVDGLVGDDAISAVVTGSITFPSESPVTNELTSYEFTAGTAGNYSVTTEDGELTMTAASVEITITAASQGWTYDGSAHQNTAVTVTSGDLLEGDELVAVATGSVTNVADTAEGNNPIAAGYKIMHGEEDVTANYQITAEAGKLTITPRLVSFTGETDKRTYTGSEIELTKVTVGGDGLVSGHKDNVTYSVKGIEAGTYNGTITAKADVKILTGENDVTKNYEITVTPGTLTISKTDEAFEISLDNDEYTYDGTAHANTNTPSSTAESGTTTFSYSFTEDGEYVADLSSLTKTDAGEYTIYVKATNPNYSSEATMTSTLKINKRTVNLISESGHKVYDGTPLTNDKVTVTGDGFVGKEGAAYDVTGTQTLVGSSENKFTYKLNEGTKATNYEIKTVFGTLTVTDGEDEGEDPVDPSLVVTKAAEEGPYALNDKVTFNITATNIYEAAQTITLSEIEGVTLAKSSFKNVPAGETITTTAVYTIAEKDILNGSFTNTVTAKMGGITKTADATVTTEKKDGHLTINKETNSTAAAEDGKYALGEKITYKITVINDGNLTITDITVTDELTGDEWPIKSLAPNDRKEFTAEYTVTEADILKGEVVNVATGKGTSPDPDEKEVPVEPGTDPEPTEEKNGHMTVTKTSTSEPASADGYMLGETIEYRIVVTNDGNLTMTNVKVEDELTGLNETIDSLAPGEEKEFTTSYVVTEKDVEAGSVVNVATAKGADPTEEEVPGEPGTNTVPVIQKYRLTVNYWIGQVNGEKAADSFTAQYMAGAEYNVASPILTGYKADKERVSGTIMADTTLDVVYTAGEYTLTIYYVYEDGTQAAPTYQRTLTYGEAYSVLSPVIDGYTANFRLVTGEMPARNMVYTIRYQAAGNGIIIEDYDTPLGLSGFGVCIGETYE